MAYRNPNMIMPTLEDIILQLLGMAETFYDGAWSVGWSQYDNYRPNHWPTAWTMLKFHGYMPNATEWQRFVEKHTGLDVLSVTAHRQRQAERTIKRWNLGSKPDYTTGYNEEYAAMFDGGLVICQATYERTGRMILR